jgi:DNA polymerase-3 subunit delta'
MGTEAQNALLKILEEPPADTLLILTANGIRGLLPTILSRVQIITLYPPAESEIRAHFANQSKAASAVTQAYFLSGGLPGLMKAILDEDNEHPLLASVTQAKELLRQKPFERLVQVEALSKQKDKGAHLIDALLRIAEISLDTAAKKESATQIKQWYRILNEVQQAREALAQSANTKLVFTNLMLHM